MHLEPKKNGATPHLNGASIHDLVDSAAKDPQAKIPPIQGSAPKMAPRHEGGQSPALRHFRLHSNPFADNVNPEFFFRTEAHEEAYRRMRQCVSDDISLGLTTAVSGTGKTMLSQILLQDLDPRQYKPVLVLAYPGMSRVALLREFLNEMGVEPMEKGRANVHNLFTAIQEEIIRLHRRGIKLVAIIDEVHFLKAESLHILRTLSNVEVPQRKLITLLLFGEESFLERMDQPGYRALFSRIFERVSLRPLARNEVEQYVKFRCLMAGGGPGLFSTEIFDPLFALTGGIPREINRICHNALGNAATRGSIHVDAACLV